MGGNNDGGIDPATGGLAFGLTCAAGMCTTIGAAVVFNEKVMARSPLRFLQFYGELPPAIGQTALLAPPRD